ncbi:MAG: hypothetical protein Q8L78_06705 [Coxiellaceae bacterium]|nr:hypothetical protein [Coxiellaceae bacterium]
MENKKIDKHTKADCHKKAAGYYQEAAKHHLEAAKHCEADDCAKAALETVKAFGFASAGKKQLKKVAFHCAGIDCCADKEAHCSNEKHK